MRRPGDEGPIHTASHDKMRDSKWLSFPNSDFLLSVPLYGIARCSQDPLIPWIPHGRMLGGQEGSQLAPTNTQEELQMVNKLSDRVS